MTTPAHETVPAPLTLTLFGPMHVFVAGRPLPRLHSRKSLWLLALLALRAGRPVEREWLAGTLWPDADQDQAFANLRPVLSDLRRALGAEGARLQSPNRHTLCLDLADADVDVPAFDAAVARKTPESLAEAVALYAGPLLEGCAEEWAPQERRSREEDCLRALQTLGDTALAAGDYGKAAEYSRRAVALDPWREAARRGLMEALSRGGDTNAALQVYREFTELLRADPKAAPDAETSALYTRLRAEARRQSSPTPVAVTEAPAPTVTGYLPHPLTDLVGREDECLEVAARLRRSRLVTLTGPGGIGKTRLAVAVAGDAAPEFADGVWLVSLESLSDESRLEGQIASVLGLKETPGQSWRESLLQHLRAKRLLLVLDNCEHLRDACAQVAGSLLQGCARVRVLATSREALGITGETVCAVPALAVPDLAHLPTNRATLARVLAGYDSVQLFVERAQAVQKTFSLTGDNAVAVAQICVRLEGMPLAIELAAARVNVLTVSEIASRLDDHLGLLAGGNRAGPSRQQTMRATLDWSHSLLDGLEQRLMRRLSVFAGGWSLPAAESVCGGDGLGAAQVLDLTASLADKSLVLFEAGGAEGRYRFLETVRQYAAERLEKSGEAEKVRARFGDWCAAFAESTEPYLKGLDQTVWLQRLDLEHPNLRAALEWCGTGAERAATGLRLANALCLFWNRRGHYSEGRQSLARALEQAGGQADIAARARALSGAGGLAQRQSDYAAARMLYEESLSLSRESGDRAKVALLLGNLGATASSLGDTAQARSLYEESLSIHQELGNRENIAQILGNLGNLTRAEGDPVSARTLYEQSLHLHRELGDMSKILWGLRCLGNAVYALGDYRVARDLCEESLALARELGEKRAVVESLITLGIVCLDQGELTVAQPCFEESLSLARALDEPYNVAWSLICLGALARARNDSASGQGLYEQGLNLFRGIGNRRGEAWALYYLGEVTQDQGDSAAAQTRFWESMAILQAIGDKAGFWRCLSGLAAAMLGLGKTQRAARLWGASEALRERVGEPQKERERAQYEQGLAQARAILGEDEFAATWVEGRALTWEQAVEFALEEAPLRGTA